MRSKALSAALAVFLLCSAVFARADENAERDLLMRAIREFLDRVARVSQKPEGFVDPPDPSASPSWCRLEGTVRVGETPLAGSRIRLLWVSKDVAVTSRVAPVVTTDAGTFVFPRVPLGEYRMKGDSEEGEWAYPAAIVLKSPGSKRLDVSLGARKLLVTVLGQDLRPVAGASVSRWSKISLTSVRPRVTDLHGRTTIGFLGEGLNELRAVIGDVSGFVRVYGVSDVREVRVILPPFGTVEVVVTDWKPDESVGSIRLTRVRDGGSMTLGTSIDESGRAVLRCSPGPWELSLEEVRGSAMVPVGGRTLFVRAGEAISVELAGK